MRNRGHQGIKRYITTILIFISKFVERLKKTRLSMISEILSEMKLFSKYEIKYYDDINLCVRDAENKNQLVVFFDNTLDLNLFIKIKKNFPFIFIGKNSKAKNIISGAIDSYLNIPFTILMYYINCTTIVN